MSSCLAKRLLPFVLALLFGVALWQLLDAKTRVWRDLFYLEFGESVPKTEADAREGVRRRTPVVIYSVPSPAYTKEARRVSFEGSIVLTATLNPNWTVTDIKPGEWACVYGASFGEMSLPYGLTEEAMRAASRIRFKPANEDGRDVAVSVEVDCKFGRVHGGPRVGFCLPRRAFAVGGEEWPLEYQLSSLHE